MSSATTSKNGDRNEQAGSSGAESNERQVPPSAEESCRPAARPSLVQELAARTGCAVSASGSESGVSPSSSLGDVPPFAPAPSPAGSAPPCSSYLLQQLASSCSFPNSLDGVQSTCHSSPCGGPASSMQLRSSPSAAASFFARAAQRLNLSSKRRRRHGGGSAAADGSQSAADGPVFVTRYAELLRDSPPAVPPALLRGLSRKDTGLGKVKVMLRVCPAAVSGGESSSSCSTPSHSPAHEPGTSVGGASSFLQLDSRKKQVTLYDPTSSGSCGGSADRASSGDEATTPSSPSSAPARLTGVAAPKMFAFDAVFSQDATQAEVCSSALTELVQAVVNGTDACLFVYGPAGLGKTWTMLGSGSSQELGAIPCAVSWLFRLIDEHKQRTGARFSVRVSAVQVAGRSEHLRDLLAEQANGTEGSGTAPGLYLRDDPILGTKLMNYSELRAPTAEKAAFLLDAAVAAAAAANQRSESESRNRHFLFTLHVYQYRVDKSGRGGVAGGRSRLHLFDLGSCERGTKAGGPLSLSALGNVILALFNAQKRLPFRESKVTQLLKEALGSVTCRAAMIAHVSPLSANYAETLATIQLASRVHRMRRKKLKYGSTMTSAAADGVEGVCRPFMRTQALNEEGSGPRSGSSDPEYTSSSEQSCDTVIYVGRHQDFTDNEGPPPALETVLSAPTPQNSPARTVTSKPAESPARHGGSSSALGPAVVTRPEASASSKCGAANRDACSSPSTAESHGKAHHTLKKSHRGGGGSAAASTKDPPVTSAATASHDAAGGARRASDELWIDGPRFSKPRFDSRTLDQLQKEQWVDGPAVAAAVYGYMDDHKKNMVERWVQEHSRFAQGHKGSKKHRPASVNRTETEPSPKSTPEHRKTRTHHEHHSKRRSSPERLHVNGGCSREQHHERKTAHDAFSSEQQQHGPKAAKCAPSKKDQGQNTMTTTTTATTTREDVAPCQDVHMTPAEEEQPESPVQMQDCCLQVTEEDILAATSGWPAANDENPLPEVDQGSSKNGAGSGSQGSHPLRVLSDDGLNLPSSFTDSRSVSVDLNHVVGDDAEILGHVYGGLTWKLLQGTLLQRRRERHQRLYGDDLSVGVKGDVLTEKLERIARLRKLTSPYFDNNNERIPSLLIMRSGTSSPTGGRYGSLPNRKQRKDLCDDHDGSTDDGSNSDCADVTSTKSEPADLDAADRYDIQRLNIKPMNGLKLEAFYNRIQKSNSSLAESQDLSPPKLSPQGDTLFQSYSEKLDLLAKDFGVFPGAHDPPVIDVQPHRLFPLLNANSEPDGLPVNQRVPPQGTEAPPTDTSPPEASGDCASPAACSFARQPRRLSSGGPSEDVAARLAQNGDHAEKSTSKPNRVLANGTRVASSTQQHVKQEQHSSPKRAIASGSKPQRRLSSGTVPVPGTAVTLAHKIHMSPSRAAASPTNSACGTLASCCSPTRSRASAKNGRAPIAPATPATVITKGPCSNGKHCDPTRLPKKPPHGSKLSPVGTATATDGGDATSAANNPLCRSVSTPTTPCSAIDSKSAIQRAETVDSGVLPSPYATVTQARPTIRKSSSGHGSSDSSSFKGVMKTVQVVQCSGTSSGYESIILRDSTPASSQDSGSERGNKEARGRKGSRKVAQGGGVGGRSRSAPGRSPPESPPVRRRQHMPGLGRHVQRWHQQHGHDLRGGQPEDEVGCAGLLCCRLLDFY